MAVNRGRQLWWYKVYMFNNTPQIGWDDVLYLDLDTVIIHDIVHLYKHESDSFMILQDFNPCIYSIIFQLVIVVLCVLIPEIIRRHMRVL